MCSFYFNYMNLMLVLLGRKSHGSTIGKTADYGLYNPAVGVRVPVLSRIFISSYRPERLLGHPASYKWALQAFSLGVKRQRREADRSPSTITEVEKM
jgi:hypothetical protein